MPAFPTLAAWSALLRRYWIYIVQGAVELGCNHYCTQLQTVAKRLAKKLWETNTPLPVSFSFFSVWFPVNTLLLLLFAPEQSVGFPPCSLPAARLAEP